MKLNWNFLGGGGGGGVQNKNLPWGGVWIYSGTQHNATKTKLGAFL